MKGVLITHHHFDHTNGLSNLLNERGLEVYGPKNNVNGINNIVKNNDKFTVIGIDFEVIEIPGHTLDHIAFYSFNSGEPILFVVILYFQVVVAECLKELLIRCLLH